MREEAILRSRTFRGSFPGVKRGWLLIFSALFFYLSFPNFLSLSGFPALAWVFGIPLFALLRQQSFSRRIWWGFLWGVLAHGLLVFWFRPYSWAGFLAFVLFLSVQPVLFAAFWRETSNRLLDMLYLPSLWVATECLRGLMMRGFGWGLGYSQAFHPYFVQFAGVGGGEGLSFVLMLGNYAGYRIVKDRARSFFWVLLTLCVVGLWGYGGHARAVYGAALQKNPGMRVCAVQPDIDYRDKRNENHVGEILDRNIRLTQGCFSQHPDLIAWPETAVPADLSIDPAWQERILEMIRKNHVSLLSGLVFEQDGRYFNGAKFITPDGGISEEVYQKQQLVPFSEYIPGGVWGERLARKLKIFSYHFLPGKTAGTLEFSGWGKMGVLICSEDAMPRFARREVAQGARALFVLLNDGWFYDQVGLRLHLQQSVMRAVENRISVVRVSNNGWSAYIDPLGNIDAGQLKPYQPGDTSWFIVLDRPKGTCPYWGDFISIFCFVFVIIMTVVSLFFSKGTRE